MYYLIVSSCEDVLIWSPLSSHAARFDNNHQDSHYYILSLFFVSFSCLKYMDIYIWGLSLWNLYNDLGCFKSLCTRQTYLVHHRIINPMTKVVKGGVRCWGRGHLVVVYVPIMMDLMPPCDCGLIWYVHNFHYIYRGSSRVSFLIETMLDLINQSTQMQLVDPH